MAKTLMTILILLPTLLLSQTKKNYTSSYPTIELFAGTNFLNANPTIVNQTYYGGLGFQYLWPMDPRHLGLLRVDFRYTIPTNSKINDTTSYLLNGIIGSFSFGGVYFPRKGFSLPISLGLNFGQTQLQTNDNSIFKNDNIAPKISIQPKLTFKRVFFAVGLEYCYDLSRSAWKPSLDNSSISNFNQTCISTYFSIGLCLGKP